MDLTGTKIKNPKQVQSEFTDAVKKRDFKTIESIIEQINTNYIQSSNYQNIKSGFYAYHQMAQLIYSEMSSKEAKEYVKLLTEPVMDCLDNKEEKVRISALDCLKLLTQSFSQLILVNFNNIFDRILNRATDYDEGVRKEFNNLDTVLKSVVLVAIESKKYFPLEEFVIVLEQKLKLKAHLIKSVIVEWIKRLQSQKQYIDMFPYLPRLAGGLFTILGDSEIQLRKSVDQLIGDFQKEIEVSVSKKDFNHKITSDIFDILVRICQRENNYAKLTAMAWIFDYLKYFRLQIDHQKESRNEIILDRNEFKIVIFNKIPSLIEPILTLLSHDEKEIRRAAQKTNELLLQIMEKVKYTSKEFVNLFPVVKDMINQKTSTIEQALVWMDHLLRTYSEDLLPNIDSVLGKLFEKLTDAEGLVLQNVMKVLGSISVHDQYFDLVINKILNAFYNNKELLNKRSDIIIKKFCSLLNPEKVYTAFAAKIIEKQNQYDIWFISTLVKTFESIMATDKDLKDLRNVLRSLKFDESKQKENIKTFETLFQFFSFNPVSTITLCFLIQEYELAYKIIKSFSEIEIDMDTLVCITKIVEILESEIFVCNQKIKMKQLDLRLQLLETEQEPYLLKCLKGLMMLLPQGAAYIKLSQRIKCVNALLGEQDRENHWKYSKKVLVHIDQESQLLLFRKTIKLVQNFKREAELKEF